MTLVRGNIIYSLDRFSVTCGVGRNALRSTSRTTALAGTVSRAVMAFVTSGLQVDPRETHHGVFLVLCARLVYGSNPEQPPQHTKRRRPRTPLA